MDWGKIIAKVIDKIDIKTITIVIFISLLIYFAIPNNWIPLHEYDKWFKFALLFTGVYIFIMVSKWLSDEFKNFGKGWVKRLSLYRSYKSFFYSLDTEHTDFIKKLYLNEQFVFNSLPENCRLIPKDVEEREINYKIDLIQRKEIDFFNLASFLQIQREFCLGKKGNIIGFHSVFYDFLKKEAFPEVTSK